MCGIAVAPIMKTDIFVDAVRRKPESWAIDCVTMLGYKVVLFEIVDDLLVE